MSDSPRTLSSAVICLRTDDFRTALAYNPGSLGTPHNPQILGWGSWRFLKYYYIL